MDKKKNATESILSVAKDDGVIGRKDNTIFAIKMKFNKKNCLNCHYCFGPDGCAFLEAAIIDAEYESLKEGGAI